MSRGLRAETHRWAGRDGETAPHVRVLDREVSSVLTRTPADDVRALVDHWFDGVDGIAAPLHQMSLDPALTPLGPWRPPAWMRPLGVVTEMNLPGTRPPLAFLSRTHALCGDRMIRFSETLAESSSPHGDGWSTVGTDGRLVLKAEVASTEYLERTQVLGEARFLADQGNGSLRTSLPRLRATSAGVAVNTLLREAVPGVPFALGAAERRVYAAQAFLTAQVDWSRAGLFHNDLRPWNLLMDGPHVRLIDFADAGPADADVDGLPQVIALAGVLAWLLGVDLPSDAGFATRLRSEAEAVLGCDLASLPQHASRWHPDVLLGWAGALHQPPRAALADMLTTMMTAATAR